MARSISAPIARPWIPEGLSVRTERPFLTLRRMLALLILLFASALALLYLWQSWQAVYWLNQVQANREKLLELQAQRDQLQLQVAQAFSLERIEVFARQRLGMIHPPLKFLILPPAGSTSPPPPPKKP